MIGAIFLLAVFSLNTVLGFACSIGIDMGYNSSHHQHGSLQSSEKTHAHKSGIKHSQGTSHNPGHKHTHGTTKSTPDDCCANEITKFIQLDKSVVRTNLDMQAPTFVSTFNFIFFQPSLNENNFAHSSGLLPVRRSCSLYDTDIRIAIQSFQI